MNCLNLMETLKILKAFLASSYKIVIETLKLSHFNENPVLY